MTRRDASDGSPPREATRVGVALPAAGSGKRMGGVRKAWLEVLGEPVLSRALRPFLADDRVVRVVVALAAADAKDPPAWLAELAPRVRVVEGGATRGGSVRLALEALPEEMDVIVVHDAARPLVTGEVVRACIDAAAAGVGAVAGSPVVDTMKWVDESESIESTPDRSRLWHAHTPQAFPAHVLREAYTRGGDAATDDAALVERLGLEVRMIDDGSTNLKVTRPLDVAIAEAILSRREADDG